MSDPAVIRRMRERANQLRRMAAMTHNEEITGTLLKMAGEIEADAGRLEAEGKALH